MVRSLHRAWSRCKAGASSGRTTRKEISTPLGRVSVWSLFMPIILYLWCLYGLRRGVLGTSGVGVSRKFARTRNGARRWRRRGPERKSPGPRRFPLKELWLGVLGPNLAVDLLDEGLAILILLLVLADLLELLDRKAVEVLHDVLYSQVLVVRGLQGTEDGGLKLLLPGGLLSPAQDLLGLLGGLLGYPKTLAGGLLGGSKTLPCYLLGGLKPLLGGPLEGPHALLCVGEGAEEVPVGPDPTLAERPKALLLSAHGPREGLCGAHVVLALLAHNLDGLTHPALHELGVALLELQEPYAVGEELLSRPGVVLLQLHELEPVVGKPDAAALDAREVLGEGLVSIALGLSHLAGGARRLVDVCGGSHHSTSVIDSKSLLLCSYHIYIRFQTLRRPGFFLHLFTEARRRGVLRTSPVRSSWEFRAAGLSEVQIQTLVTGSCGARPLAMVHLRGN